MDHNKQRHLKPKNKNKDTKAFKKGQRVKGLMPDADPKWNPGSVSKKMANNSNVNTLSAFFNSK